MRAFACGHCGQLVFFENSVCLRCSTELGFVPSGLELVAGSKLRRCENLGPAGCNWLLEPGDAGPLCRSCALTRTRPPDADHEGLAAFATAEAAKRRLLFQLLDLGLPVEADGLASTCSPAARARSSPATTRAS